MAGPPTQKTPPWIRHWGTGFEFAAAIAGFGLIGWWVDSRWNTGPWGVLVGVALGMIGATYNLIRSTRGAFGPKYQKGGPTRREDRNDSDSH